MRNARRDGCANGAVGHNKSSRLSRGGFAANSNTPTGIDWDVPLQQVDLAGGLSN